MLHKDCTIHMHPTVRGFSRQPSGFFSNPLQLEQNEGEMPSVVRCPTVAAKRQHSHLHDALHPAGMDGQDRFKRQRVIIP